MTARELLLAPFAFMPPPRVLDGLTAEQADRRLPGAPHTIVEVVAHLGFWQTWFLERVTGRPVPMPTTASLGWPAADGTAWDQLRREFVDGLDRAVALAEYTVADAMTHVAMHNAHHFGSDRYAPPDAWCMAAARGELDVVTTGPSHIPHPPTKGR